MSGRRRVLLAIESGCDTLPKIMERTSLSYNNVTQYLSRLRRAGMIDSERRECACCQHEVTYYWTTGGVPKADVDVERFHHVTR